MSGAPHIAPTHTFQEFCTEVTVAIQPTIAKIIQDTLQQHIPPPQYPWQMLQTDRQQQAPQNPSLKQMPPQKRQRTDGQGQPTYQLSDDENDFIGAPSQQPHRPIPPQPQSNPGYSQPQTQDAQQYNYVPPLNLAPHPPTAQQQMQPSQTIPQQPTQQNTTQWPTQQQPAQGPQDATLAALSGHLQNYLQPGQQQTTHPQAYQQTPHQDQNSMPHPYKILPSPPFMYNQNTGGHTVDNHSQPWQNKRRKL